MEYMNKKECAAFLRISQSAVDNLRLNEGLPYIRLGKRVLFDKELVVQYMAKRTIVIK